MSHDIEFRPYLRTDLPACADLCNEAFPLVSGRFAGQDVGKVMSGQVDGSRVSSNYQELAIVDREVAGLLFGWVKRGPMLADIWRALNRLLLIGVRCLLGRYGSRRRLIGLVRPGVQELRALTRNMPDSEAQVLLFAVAPRYHGIGLGRALMDRFVNHARRYRVRSVSVPTDETASFWFYEKYGFTRWAEYESPMESYLAGRPIKGFIYRLLLPEAHVLAPE